jgi:hypothetical protein
MWLLTVHGLLSWALAVAAVNSRTVISPSKEGLRLMLNVLFNTFWLRRRNYLYTSASPAERWSPVVMISTDFHITSAARLPLVSYIQQYTRSTVPSSLTWLGYCT